MTKRLFGAPIALLIIGVAPAAYAHTAGNRPAGAGGGHTSCVGFNNNGVCDSTDTLLGPVLQHDQGLLNTTDIVRPSDAPQNGPVGIVLGNTRAAHGFLSISATGSVTVNGTINAGNDGYLKINAADDLTVAPGAKIKGGSLGVHLTATGDVTIGDGATVTGRGDSPAAGVEVSGNNITIGNGVTLSASGYGAALNVGANGALRVGADTSLTTAGTGEGPAHTVLSAYGDINLNAVHLAGRGVEVDARGSGESAARHITISNSIVNILGNDGARFDLSAAAGIGGEGSVTLSHDTVTPPGSIQSSPAAVINERVEGETEVARRRSGVAEQPHLTAIGSSTRLARTIGNADQKRSALIFA